MKNEFTKIEAGQQFTNYWYQTTRQLIEKLQTINFLCKIIQPDFTKINVYLIYTSKISQISLACQTACVGPPKKTVWSLSYTFVNIRNVVKIHHAIVVCQGCNHHLIVSVSKLKGRFELTMFDEPLLKVFNIPQ